MLRVQQPEGMPSPARGVQQYLDPTYRHFYGFYVKLGGMQHYLDAPLPERGCNIIWGPQWFRARNVIGGGGEGLHRVLKFQIPMGGFDAPQGLRKYFQVRISGT